MGKSTLLENMAIQDIQNGNGMAFIDPHGKTAELLLRHIPEERIKDVIYFAPHDTDWPVSFNVMEDVGKDQRHLVANGLMASFKKIWPDVWSARMEYISNNILLALLEYPDSTLLGINRMLSDKAYRKMIVANISDPSVKAFWTDEFAKYTDKYMQEAGAAIQNKFGQFVSNPLIRNIIGQSKSSFDIRQMMDTKKILIINLSKGRMGEINSNLIGSMLITKIYLAAMSRANIAESELQKLPDFYFYVDEFQSFVNDSFKDILSEARKYKLNLTIAHQYIEQVPEEVRSAVFGNVGTTISFRVGPFDAEVLEKIFGPKFMAEDLVNLGFAQIYLTLMIDGVGSPPFSAKTLPSIPGMEKNYFNEVVDYSRKTYARPRDIVEEEVRKWHEPIIEESKGGWEEKGVGFSSSKRPIESRGGFEEGRERMERREGQQSSNRFGQKDLRPSYRADRADRPSSQSRFNEYSSPTSTNFGYAAKTRFDNPPVGNQAGKFSSSDRSQPPKPDNRFGNFGDRSQENRFRPSAQEENESKLSLSYLKPKQSKTRGQSLKDALSKALSNIDKYKPTGAIQNDLSPKDNYPDRNHAKEGGEPTVKKYAEDVENEIKNDYGSRDEIEDDDVRFGDSADDDEYEVNEETAEASLSNETKPQIEKTVEAKEAEKTSDRPTFVPSWMKQGEINESNVKEKTKEIGGSAIKEVPRDILEDVLKIKPDDYGRNKKEEDKTSG